MGGAESHDGDDVLGREQYAWWTLDSVAAAFERAKKYRRAQSPRDRARPAGLATTATSGGSESDGAGGGAAESEATSAGATGTGAGAAGAVDDGNGQNPAAESKPAASEPGKTAEAAARASQTGDDSGSPEAPDDAETSAIATKVWIKPRDWMDVFTDFGVIRDGQWLALPQSVYAIFAPNGEPEVDVMEVLLVLALFCEGLPEEQLTLAFNMFDIDESGAMNLEEMLVFFRCLCEAAYKIRIIPERPSSKEVEKVGREMFSIADVDGDDSMSCSEFVTWCGLHVVSQRILANFKAVKRSETKKLDKRKLHTVDEFGRLSNPEQESRIKSLAMSNEARARVVRQLEAKKPFGIEELRTLGVLFNAKASEMLTKYKAAAGRDKEEVEEGSLARPEFCGVMLSEYPNVSRALIGRLFDILDADGSGWVDSKEFTLGLVKMIRASTLDKLQLIFEVFDTDGSGDVSIGELMDVVQKGNDEMADIAAFTSDIVDSLDRDGDGSISRGEFVAALKDNPILYDCFASSSLPSLDTLKADFTALAHAGTRNEKFDIAFVERIWERCNSSGGGGSRAREMTLPGFRTFMQQEFGVTQEHMQIINKIFLALDSDNSGSLGWQELFFGLAQVVESDKDDRVSFYFTLYDMDGSGEMDKDEIIQMVMASQEAVNASVSKTLSLLKRLDIDGDGRITLDEFKESGKKNPELIECFCSLFAADESADTGPYMSREERKIDEVTRLLRGDDSPPPEEKLKLGGPGAEGGEAPPPVVKKSTGGRSSKNKVGLDKLRKMSLSTVGKVVSQLQTMQTAADQARGEAASSKGVANAETVAVTLASKTYSDMLAQRLGDSRYGLKDKVEAQVEFERKHMPRRVQTKLKAVTALLAGASPLKGFGGASAFVSAAKAAEASADEGSGKVGDDKDDTSGGDMSEGSRPASQSRRVRSPPPRAASPGSPLAAGLGRRSPSAKALQPLRLRSPKNGLSSTMPLNTASPITVGGGRSTTLGPMGSSLMSGGGGGSGGGLKATMSIGDMRKLRAQVTSRGLSSAKARQSKKGLPKFGSDRIMPDMEAMERKKDAKKRIERSKRAGSKLKKAMRKANTFHLGSSPKGSHRGGGWDTSAAMDALGAQEVQETTTYESGGMGGGELAALGVSAAVAAVAASPSSPQPQTTSPPPGSASLSPTADRPASSRGALKRANSEGPISIVRFKLEPIDDAVPEGDESPHRAGSGPVVYALPGETPKGAYAGPSGFGNDFSEFDTEGGDVVDGASPSHKSPTSPGALRFDDSPGMGGSPTGTDGRALSRTGEPPAWNFSPSKQVSGGRPPYGKSRGFGGEIDADNIVESAGMRYRAQVPTKSSRDVLRKIGFEASDRHSRRSKHTHPAAAAAAAAAAERRKATEAMAARLHRTAEGKAAGDAMGGLSAAVKFGWGASMSTPATAPAARASTAYASTSTAGGSFARASGIPGTERFQPSVPYPVSAAAAAAAASDARAHAAASQHGTFADAAGVPHAPVVPHAVGKPLQQWAPAQEPGQAVAAAAAQPAQLAAHVMPQAATMSGAMYSPFGSMASVNDSLASGSFYGAPVYPAPGATGGYAPNASGSSFGSWHADGATGGAVAAGGYSAAGMLRSVPSRSQLRPLLAKQGAASSYSHLRNDFAR